MCAEIPIFLVFSNSPIFTDIYIPRCAVRGPLNHFRGADITGYSPDLYFFVEVNRFSNMKGFERKALRQSKGAIFLDISGFPC
jgi:hypothetical protein